MVRFSSSSEKKKLTLNRVVNFFFSDELENLTIENYKLPAILTTEKCNRKKRHKTSNRMPEYQNIDHKVTLKSNGMYWSLGRRKKSKIFVSHLEDFDEEIMNFFSPSWRWLLVLCSDMLHISPRDIYGKVLEFEQFLQISEDFPDLKVPK